MGMKVLVIPPNKEPRATEVLAEAKKRWNRVVKEATDNNYNLMTNYRNKVALHIFSLLVIIMVILIHCLFSSL